MLQDERPTMRLVNITDRCLRHRYGVQDTLMQSWILLEMFAHELSDMNCDNVLCFFEKNLRWSIPSADDTLSDVANDDEWIMIG